MGTKGRLGVALVGLLLAGACGGDPPSSPGPTAGVVVENAQPGSPAAEGNATGSSAGSCVALEINASLEKGELVSELADSYNQFARTPGGQCTAVTVHRTTSGVAMSSLLEGWNETRLGAPAPQVWTPTSSLWVSLLRKRSADQGKQLVADGNSPSVAQSPLSIAMPKPMAEALGWPAAKVGWADVLALTNDPGGWASRGHPEWGPFTLGKDNPLRSTSGMAATVASYYAATGRSSDITLKDLDDPQVRAFVSGVEGGVVHYADEALKFLNNLAEADAKGQATSYISAVVLQEQLVYLYDVGNPTGEREKLENGTAPKVPLVAIHPSDGTLMMDHPFVVLPSASAEQRAVADGFLAYLQEPAQQARFARWGFRDANGVASDKLAATIGQPSTKPPSLITSPSPDVLSRMLDDWPDLRKRARVLLVFDVSGSMNEEAWPGTSRLDAAKAAAIASVGQLHPDDEVGLWVFSSEQHFVTKDNKNPLPYQEVVTPAPLRSSQDQLVDAIGSLYAEGGTALYHTIRQAERSMRAKLDRSRINAIVVLSDGMNDYPLDNDLGALLGDLDAGNLELSVRVFAIAFDQQSELNTLTQIARASRAAAYDARDPSTINDVFTSVLSNF
jgi:Ca-activated chloride channel homolog